MLNNFKFKTSFSSELKFSSNAENFDVSNVDLDGLKKLIPESLFNNGNIDILPIVANVCVANLSNKNGDLISLDTAKKIYKNFIYRYINKDHLQSDISGVIVNAGFSEYETNTVVSEELLSENKLYNISIAGGIYYYVDPQLTDLLEEASDKKSEYYRVLSLSWELAFNDYSIVVGTEKLYESKIIKSSDKEFDKYNKLLKIFGGKGVDDSGNIISRLIEYPCYPLGVGITPNPAAFLSGILTASCKEMPDELNLSEKIHNVVVVNQLADITKQIEIINNTFSNQISELRNQYENDKTKNSEHSENDSVKPFISSSIMHIKNFKQLEEKWEDFVKLDPSVSVASITSFFQEEIAKKSEEWTKEKKDKEAEVLAEKNKAEEISKELEKIKDSHSKIESELKALKEEQEKAIAQEKFNNRMEEFNAEFNLDDEDRQILAEDIRDMEDTVFASYKTKMSKLLKGKKKVDASEQDNDANVKDEKNEDVVVDNALNKAEITDKNDVVNSNNNYTNETLKDKWKRVFSANINGANIKLVE